MHSPQVPCHSHKLPPDAFGRTLDRAIDMTAIEDPSFHDMTPWPSALSRKLLRMYKVKQKSKFQLLRWYDRVLEQL